ncbi:hypothetical protein FXO38_00707 [Capsicum annuum]|nr:hypothetical protein FXO38_00707 [Capsicum annuum]
MADLIEDLKDKTIPKKYKEKLCLVWFSHFVILARDVKKFIEDDLLALAKDLKKFNDYPWGYDNYNLTAKYLLMKLSPKTITFYDFPWAFMVVHSWIMSTEQELGMTSFITLAIRRAVRQGHPNVEDLYDQPSATNSGSSSGGVVGVVFDVGGSHPDANTASSRDDEHVDAQEKINTFEITPYRGPSHPYSGSSHPLHSYVLIKNAKQLVYPNACDAVDRIMDLNFYNNFKNRYNELTDLAKTLGGPRFDWLVSTYEWEKDIINYVRRKKLYPRGKSWTKAKRILVVKNMEVKYFLAVEILLEEEEIKIYDCNLPVFDKGAFLIHMQSLLELLPILLR